MPPIRSLASVRRVLLTVSIFLDGEIMSPCSRCTKKGLVYVAITASFSRQLSSCSKCTKANTCSLCNMRSVSTNECTF